MKVNRIGVKRMSVRRIGHVRDEEELDVYYRLMGDGSVLTGNGNVLTVRK